MVQWLVVFAVVIVLLLLARRLLLPKLVSAWVQRLRNDPSIDDYNRDSAYGLPAFAPAPFRFSQR